MASNYTELKAQIEFWLDNPNPNLIAEIPTLIELAEARFRRHLHVRDMECRATHAVVPTGTANSDRGIYDLPTDWGGHQSVGQANDLIRLLYWKTIPALTDSEPTNWLLTKHPDLYLYASLGQAEAWLKNDSRVPMWAQAANVALTELMEHDEHDRYSGGPIQARSDAERPWRGRNRGTGRYDYLPPFDFFELDVSGLRHPDRPGYFTVAEDKLRIWPRPTQDPTGSAGWTTCP